MGRTGMSAVLRRAKRWLYLGHRWLGIATCILFAMWFVSGVVMMYVAFPRLADDERRAMLAPLDAESVRIGPEAAMAGAGLTGWPRSLRLEMLDGEPVYRIDAADRRLTLSAVDGRRLGPFDTPAAMAVAAGLPTAVAPRLLDSPERDQWTVTARFDPHRPLHRVALGDDAGTEIYLSSRTGEVVLDTSRHERMWNWLGAIPHWIYFSALRQDGPLWRQVVLWAAGVGMAVAASGIWIGLLRARLRNRLGRPISPYRGWMLWHHVAGLTGGVLVLTWVFSGWLSLNPGRWLEARGIQRGADVLYAGNGDAAFPLDPAALRAALDGSVVEAEFAWIGGRPIVRLADATGSRRLIEGAAGDVVTFADADLARAAARMAPGVPVAFATRLEREDLHWYSHHDARVLPVLRVGFADETESWVHIDPATGEIVGRSDRTRRLRRWLFNGLHSFDLPILLRNRPAWDLVVWGVSILGLTVSVSGVVLGWRRLVRPRRRSGRPARPPG